MRAIRLRANGDFEPDPVRAALAAHAVPGGQSFDPATGDYRRLVDLEGRSFRVTVRLYRFGVELESDADRPGDREALTELTRFWFDLDTDLPPIRARLSRDPLLAPLLDRRPGLRVNHEPDGFEAAISAVLGQQVSVARGRVLGARLLKLCGGPRRGDLIAFPSPEKLAGQPFERLRAAIGLTRARARTVLAVARLFADGFRLGRESDPATARSRLLAVPGVGPWTVGYLSLRVSADPDSFPAGDAVLRRALGGITERAAADRAAGWAPYRSYAAAHLWAETAYGTPDPSRG